MKETKTVSAAVENTTVREGSVDKVMACVALADSKGRKIIYAEDGMHVQVPAWYRETLETEKPFDLTVVPCANGKWYNAVGLVNPNAAPKASKASKKKTPDLTKYFSKPADSDTDSTAEPDDAAILEQTTQTGGTEE